jgi:anti-sigma B factor antagonist
MNAKLTTRQVGDVSVVDVTGRVTAGPASKALRETLRELTSANKNKLLVNLCEIS